MKRILFLTGAARLSAAVLTAATLMLGCQSGPAKPNETPQKEPAGSLQKAQPAAAAVSSDAVPNRPEQLKFAPLNYEPPNPKEYRVPLKSGPVAYVVEDKELPLVNIAIYVRAGDYLDRPERKGLAGLTGYLLARGGTEKRTAEDLEERLAFLAAELNSGVGDTQGSVSLNLLSKDLKEGLQILREVLTQPRFQENKLALRKQQLLQAMRERNDESAAIEAREAGFLAYGEDFWANIYSTPDTINPIQVDDLKAFHRDWFWPSNFVVAVSGDFDRNQMVGQLEELFGHWPFQGKPAQAIPTNTHFASPGVYIMNKQVNQGRVSLMLPGIMRENPDYFPVVVMNDILGGGGFVSRIMNRVRSDEGLAYSAFSRFPGGVWFPLPFTAGFQTKSRTVPYASSIVLSEIKRIAEEPVSDQELETVKRGFIERFPRTFSTKAQVANTFAQDEFTGRFQREPDYWMKYRGRIESIQKPDVQRVARQWLQPDKLVILVVGEKDQVLLGHPSHEVKLQDLVKGPIVDLPERDPLTLKPKNRN